MSFADAVGQIDQILQWEQQLADGGAAGVGATGGVSPAGGVASTAQAPSTSTSTGASASFAQQLALAQADAQSGLLGSSTAAASDLSDTAAPPSTQLLSTLQSALGVPAQGVAPALPAASLTPAGSTVSAASGPQGGAASGSQDPRIQAMINEATSLEGKPYVWGGGHSGFGPQSGYDCSGFVSAVLHAGGYLSAPQDTETLPSAFGIESGPGQYVTIYDRDEAGQEGHVIIEIDGQFYESGGEHGSWGGGGGVEAISTPSAAYLSTFNVILHPAGL
ncbi:MAG: hypothetical protein ACP5H2_07780 [Solirubrobacteraceae bacterium]